MEAASTTAERPVFDVASDPETFWLPAFKEEVEEDEPKGRAANDNGITMAFRGEWIGNTFWPDQEFHRLLPEEVATKKARAEKGIERERARIALRARGVSDVANDNEVFPFLSTLRKDGDHGSIDLVIRYRALVALSEMEPLQAQDISPGGDVRTEYRSSALNIDEVDKAAAMGFPQDKVKGGEIRYKEVRQSHGGAFDLPLKKKGAADTETGMARTLPVAFKFSDVTLIASIDAKPILAELRSSIGPLLDAFEDAVLGGRTLAQIGRETGARVKPEIAGRALVMTALEALRGTWVRIVERERRLARAAEHNVEQRRRELASRRAKFFGLAD